MERIKNSIINLFSTFSSLIKWCLLAGVTGSLIGVVGAVFHHLLKSANAFRDEHHFVIFLLPIAGVCIAFLYEKFGKNANKGTNLVIEAVRTNERVHFSLAPLIIITTTLTHLCGGSAGREGAAIQMGSAIAGKIGRIIKLDENDEKILIMAGMSAGFSALFGTPIAAAIFSMEVISVGVMYYAALVPCVIAAFAGRYTAMILGGEKMKFTVGAIPEQTVSSFILTILLALLCAFAGMLFCLSLRLFARLFNKFFSNAMLKAAAGGCIVTAIIFVFGLYDYCGAGSQLISRAVQSPGVPFYVFLIKILLTSITLGAGFKGGEIVPTLFIGAALGNSFGTLIGFSPEFCACIAMTAVFCAVTNSPISSFILGVEMFGLNGALFFLLACAVSYMMSGYHGLYSSQKILYSKTEPKYLG